MTPKQLKASILQYAMEGKLVKQDTNDEPASILLEKIKAEKEKLVKEGKIKKSQKLPAIKEEEKPFDIPDSWEWVRFGNIVNFNLGKTPSKTTDIYWYNGTVPWVTIKDMQDKALSETDKQVSDRAIREVFNNNICQPNTLLMSFKLTIGKTSILNIKAVHNEAIIDIIPLIDDNHIFRNYLFFILPYISQYASSNYAIKGKTLNKASINNMLIPLPPLAEQKRIVAKIEKLLPLVEKYAEAYNRLQKIDGEFKDKLKQTILQYAMEGKLVKQNSNDESASILLEKIKAEKEKLVKEGKIKKSKKLPAIEEHEKPFDIPDSWEWVRLGNYAEKITDQVASGSFASLRENVKKYKEDNFALMVKTADFSNNFSKNLTFTDKHGYEFLSNSNLFGGELILSNIGSIGKCFIVPNLKRPMTLAPNSIMVKMTSESLIKYLYFFFNSPIGNSELWHITSGTTMKKFNKTGLKTILIPLPPLEEQKRIVAKIDRMMIQIDEIQ